MEEKNREELLRENEELRERLREAEEVLRAIREGEVDALAVECAEGEKIYTLEGADRVYRILMDSMNEGALTLARDGTILYGNLCFERMTGAVPTKLIGASVTEFIPPEERKAFEALIESARKGGSARGEVRVVGSEHAPFPAHISINAVEFDGSGGFCVIVSDLTEHKTYTARLEALNRDLSELLFVASHDLQEPLRKIRTFCSRIAACRSSGSLDEKTRYNIDRMQKSAERMQGLLHALTSYTLIRGTPEPLGVVDLEEPADGARLELSDLIADAKAQVHIFDLPAIEADAGQMRRLFHHLIENALKFRGDGPPLVKIHGEVRGGISRIFVEDNGMGFDERYNDRIFKPFQQLHGRNRFEGTGMGLAVCRKIVERHQGTITAESSPGAGSKFTITIPVKQGLRVGLPEDTVREKAREELVLDVFRLRDELKETADIVAAIREGKVDALVSHGPEGERVYTLQSADRGYRLLVESIKEGALILARDGSIFYANRRLAEMLGKAHEKISGSFLTKHIFAEDRNAFEALLHRLEDGEDARGEMRLEVESGVLLPVHVSLNSFQMEEFDGVCAIVTDLTEQKRIMEKLERSNRELQDFACIASHDLQEPLRKIHSFSNMLTSYCADSLGERARDYLNRMQNAAKRMQTFIEDLLKYSRVQTMGEPFGSLDLESTIGEVLFDLQARLAETGGSVAIGELPSIEADPLQMRQLFQNLIGNALKFHGTEKPAVRIHGEVLDTMDGTVSTSPPCGRLCRIYVEDNGIGFDESYTERIFAPFQRLHGRSAFEGSGMGLAICRRIVERHGGTITARSTPGKGSVFVVTLPVTQSQPGDS